MTTIEDLAPTTEPPVPRSRWPWVVQAVACPVVLFAALYSQEVFLLVPGLERLDEPDAPIAAVVAAVGAMNLLTLLVALGGVALLAHLDGHRRLRDVGWRLTRTSLPLLVLGMAISAIVVVCAGAPLTAAGLLRPEDAGIAGEPVWAVLAIGLSQAFVLQSVPEELIFRGYLLGSLRMRPLPAVLVSGLTFGALHLTSQGGQQGWAERFAYLAMPIGFGLAAGALMLLTRSLWVAVGVHGGLHVTLLVAMLLEQADPALAIGDGPALWLLAGLGWAAVAAAAMVLLARQNRHSTTGPRTVHR